MHTSPIRLYIWWYLQCFHIWVDQSLTQDLSSSFPPLNWQIHLLHTPWIWIWLSRGLPNYVDSLHRFYHFNCQKSSWCNVKFLLVAHRNLLVCDYNLHLASERLQSLDNRIYHGKFLYQWMDQSTLRRQEHHNQLVHVYTFSFFWWLHFSFHWNQKL